LEEKVSKVCLNELELKEITSPNLFKKTTERNTERKKAVSQPFLGLPVPNSTRLQESG